ncbi:MAG TPA: PAS domain S-box protein [Bacteroidales bacterium]|nr:PAS domain S-box protein [Bacteroidales bacterium]
MKGSHDTDVAFAELNSLRKEYISLKKSYKKVIADFRLASLKLNESEDKYRLIFEHSGEAVLFTNPNGEIYAANPEACKMFLMTEKEICTAGRNKLLDLNDPQVIAGLKTRDETGVYRGEANMFRKDGTVFTALVSSIIFKDKQGKSRTCTIIRDNTENKKNIAELEFVQQQLRQQKLELQSVFDSTPSMMCIVDEHMQVLIANDAFKKSTAWQGASLHTLCSLLGCIEYNNKASDSQTIQKCGSCAIHNIIEDTFKTGNPNINLEHSTTLCSNSENHEVVLLVSTARLNSGDAFRILLTLSDITQLKKTELALLENETRFRGIFESSVAGMSAADTNGRLVLVNSAFARMYGYENPGQMLKEVSNASQLYANPDDRSELLKSIRKDGMIDGLEVEVVKKDGTHFFILVSGRKVYDVNGKYIYYIGIHIDITDRKVIEKELRESKKSLESFNQYLVSAREEERSQISREIHDHFGQSLTALKLDMNIFKQSLSGNADAFNKINEMVDLVSDLIKDVQRISSDLRPGILEDLGLQATFEWYCSEFMKRTNTMCFLRIGKGRFDNPQINLILFRTLQEALTNIIRHSGATVVDVNLKNQKHNIKLTIRDNGKGISKHEINSGISHGLAGIRERVKQFNGKLNILSRKGTILSIIIPISDTKTDDNTVS